MRAKIASIAVAAVAVTLVGFGSADAASASAEPNVRSAGTAQMQAIHPRKIRSYAPYKFGSVKYSKWYARYYMQRKYGWGQAQYEAVVKLWQRESGWNHHSSNSSSGAYGIPQSLPGSKMGVNGSDWRHNPETQIRWGLSYIKYRYGKPTAAWATFQSRSWY